MFVVLAGSRHTHGVLYPSSYIPSCVCVLVGQHNNKLQQLLIRMHTYLLTPMVSMGGVHGFRFERKYSIPNVRKLLLDGWSKLGEMINERAKCIASTNSTARSTCLALGYILARCFKKYFGILHQLIYNIAYLLLHC